MTAVHHEPFFNSSIPAMTRPWPDSPPDVDLSPAMLRVLDDCVATGRKVRAMFWDRSFCEGRVVSVGTRELQLESKGMLVMMPRRSLALLEWR